MNKFTLVLCISFGLVVVQTSVVTFGGMKECKKVADPEDFSFMDDCRSDNSKCGFPEIKPTILGDTRIVGGNISRPNSWPWQISLQYMGSAWDWRHLCGGSIINPCYVVTAAHCVEDFITQPSNLRVVAGVHDIRKEKGSIHNVTRVYAHPLFKGSATQWDHDIAVVKVRPPMVFDRNISQICIPSDTNLVQNIAVATGWGYTSDGGKLSDVLRQVELPLIAWEECKPIYPSAINANKLCAGYLVEGGRDTCQGDSGGPLVTRISARYWLTGVTSVGSNCALPKKPGIYTNTAAYKNWLLKFIKDKNECRSNNTNRCEHVCLNTPGSYKCDCCDGYVLTEERNCFVECGKPEEMALIMDRNDVLNVSDPLTQPWMVSIRLNATPFEHRCSGVIIASRWILTTASCLVNENQTVMKANQVIALAGLSTDLEGAYYYYDNNDDNPNDYADVKEFNRCGSDSESDCSENSSSSNSTEEYEQKLTFTRFKIHEKFLSSLKKKPKSTAADPDDIAGKDYAIALLRTSYPIKFSAFVKPICISLEQAQNDDLCLVPGWRGENILTQKQVLVASRDSCETQTLRNLTKRLICAGNNHDWIQKCDEDLGSPLVCLSNEKMVVSGLSLQRCVPPRSMTVFLHLSYFRDWIVDVVNGNV